MKLLLTFILTAATLWSGYWVVGFFGTKTAFEAWFDHQRSIGRVADYSDFQVRGYPNRFDASFTGISLADPATGLAWQAPYFQILALSYQPNHIIAVWPDAQQVTTRAGAFNLTSDDMRASLRFQANAQLVLESLVLTAVELTVAPVGQQGETTAVAALTIAAERAGDSLATYRLGLSADGFAPSDQWKRLIDPGGTLPATLSALSADLTVRFDKPWGRSTVEPPLPQPLHINITRAEARWGRLNLQITGTLDVGPSGLPMGEIMIKARNWRDILALAVAAGALPGAMAEPLEDGLGLMAKLAGNPTALDIPIGFRNGQMFLGPVPLGPAPILKLR